MRMMIVACILMMTSHSWAVDVFCDAQGSNDESWAKRFTSSTSSYSSSFQLILQNAVIVLSFKVENDKLVSMQILGGRGVGVWFDDPHGRDKMRLSIANIIVPSNQYSYEFRCQVLR